ncbi:MAG TPA: TetR/AcrR family transcriptional regulator [Treponemataceae bacterium]|nr:TetR/AcrR family transcriptional regulator [Treponemataceae bacterium]HOS34746.1 TetR/AcrR family transcriptional regulator [Treponemataceae bacterium]HPL92452.1 TetR/AcrR family transcriptional regulator [Treponemataceae bacterium]
MAKNSPDKSISRREQILDAAFSIARRNVSWSMRDVAWEVGVSKPALYRHYTSRADLEQAMESRVLELLLSSIESARENTESIRTAMVRDLRAHPDYFMFFARNLITVESFHERVLSYLIENSRQIGDFFSRLRQESPEILQRKTLAIQKNAITILLAGYDSPMIREFQDELLRRNAEGFPELAFPPEVRLDELDEIPLQSETGENVKLFEAISRAIQAQGIGNVTIEKIAEEMGTAKSSLYFYYDNKQAMLSELVTHESDVFLSVLSEHVKWGKTTEEQLYLAMIAHTQYFLNKPGIIPVFNWIRYEMVTHHHEVSHPDVHHNALRGTFDFSRIKSRTSDEALEALSIVKWAMILSSGCTIREHESGKSKEDILKSIRSMYKLILFGDKELL